MLDYRFATEDDLRQIIRLLADDEIAESREARDETEFERYHAAWLEMEQETFNKLILACDGASVIGVLQLTLIAGLTRKGMKRAQIEGVRVRNDSRGQSVGHKLLSMAIDLARQHGCGLVQLTTDKRRSEARQFYESLGFDATHEGMKIVFD